MYLVVNFIDVYLNCEYGWKNYYRTFFSAGRENFQDGYLFLKKGELTLAADELKIATEKDDKLFAGWFFLGEIYHQRGDNKQVIFYLKKAKEIDGGVKKLYVLLGNIYLEENNLEEAISLFLEGKKNLFSSGEILYLLGYSYEKNDEISSALMIYDACITKFYPRSEFGKLCQGREQIIKRKYFD